MNWIAFLAYLPRRFRRVLVLSVREAHCAGIIDLNFSFTPALIAVDSKASYNKNVFKKQYDPGDNG